MPGSEQERDFLIKIQETDSIVYNLLSFCDHHFKLIDRETVLTNNECKKMVSIYFMSAVDILCQSMDKDDMVWSRTTLDILIYIGYTRSDAIFYLKYFVNGEFTETDNYTMQEAAASYNKYAKEEKDVAVSLELLLMAHAAYIPKRIQK